MIEYHITQARLQREREERMSLDWRTTGTEIQNQIEALEEGSKDQQLLILIRNSVVWATLAVQFPGDAWKLTEKNWKEFYQRVHHWERTMGSYMTSPDGPVYLTPENIHMCIGLVTNVGNLSRAKWKEQIVSRMEEQANRKIQEFEGMRKEAA